MKVDGGRGPGGRSDRRKPLLAPGLLSAVAMLPPCAANSWGVASNAHTRFSSTNEGIVPGWPLGVNWRGGTDKSIIVSTGSRPTAPSGARSPGIQGFLRAVLLVLPGGYGDYPGEDSPDHPRFARRGRTGRIPRGSRAMPLGDFEREVLRLLAANRHPDSFVGGGTVLHQSPGSPRTSKDVDYFHDTIESLSSSAQRDVATLRAAGYEIELERPQDTFQRAIVHRGRQQTKVEWVFDSAFRFFPVEPDLDRHNSRHRAVSIVRTETPSTVAHEPHSSALLGHPDLQTSLHKAAIQSGPLV